MLHNFKYYAGLADADAFIGLSFHKSTNDNYSVYATVQFGFRWDSADKVLPDLASHYKVTIFEEEKTSPPGELQKRLTLSGNKAVRFLQETSKHLVIKRAMAEYVMEMNGRSLAKEELPEVRARIKALRADQTLSKKDYPSNQWLAGYIDGDGCLTSQLNASNGCLAFKLVIASHKDDPQGVQLIRKFYGGVVNVRKDGNLSYVLVLSDKGAGDKFFSGVLPHIRVKRAQADLIRAALRDGRHLKKNGATLKSNEALHERLKELKKSRKPQRLNEITPAGEATV